MKISSQVPYRARNACRVENFNGDFGAFFVREFAHWLRGSPQAWEFPPWIPQLFLLCCVVEKRATRGKALGQESMNSCRRIVAWCIAGLVLAVSGVTLAEDPKQIQPTGYVTDLAAILKPEAKTQLEALCTELEQKTGAQLAVVTVKSLNGNEIQPFANDLFQHFGVGKKKEDNGVMLLVAPNDRKYWTEVGYGLEPIINDARAGDAGRLMVPFFRQGDYSSGIQAAAWQLAEYVADDKGVTLTGISMIERAPPERQHDDTSSGLWILIVFAFLIFRVLSGAIRNTSGRGRGGGMGTGLLVGAIIGNMMGGRRGGWGGGGGGWSGGGGGFGGFGGGSSGGGGAGGSW